MDDALIPVMEGVRLAAAGMGTVFVFLTVLVWATSVMSRLVLRFSPPPSCGGSPDEAEGSGISAHAHLVAVVSAAIHAHRSRKR